jgi:hypothetical protein
MKKTKSMLREVLGGIVVATLGACGEQPAPVVDAGMVPTPKASPVAAPVEPTPPQPAVAVVTDAGPPPAPPGPPPFVGGELVDCDNGYLVLDKLHLEVPADYVEERVPDGPAVRSSGQPCGGRRARRTCLKALAGLDEPAGPSFFNAPMRTFWVFTSGGTAKKTTLAALLGTIDTGNEALLVASKEFGNIVCAARKDAAGFHFRGERTTGDCPMTSEVVDAVVHADATITIEKVLETKTRQICAGRRPLPDTVIESARASTWCSAVARLEALSVVAFVQMRRELIALSAPPSLVARVIAAIDDELRHAQLMGDLAASRGGVRPRVVGCAGALRGARALAEDNVVEGCVREAWGALVATWQGVNAATPELRALFAAIADDETEHAALSFDVQRWLSTQLDDDANAMLAERRRQALDALADETGADEAGTGNADLGLPSTAERRALFDRFVAAWG